MAKADQTIEQPSGQVLDATVDRVHADRLEMSQTRLDRRQREEVDRAVLEAGRARREHVARLRDPGHADRSACEPRPPEPGQRVVANDQRSHAGRVADRLVPGHRDEVRVPARQVEPVRRHEGGRVEQHVPAASLRRRDPLEWMPDARVVRLGRDRRTGAARPGEPRSSAANDGRRRRAEGRARTAGRSRRSRPGARANSRIPLTELWLSAVRTSRLRSLNGYDSPTSLSAALAFAVKTTVYSSGEAFTNDSTAARARSASSVAAREVGLSECGLPKTPSRSSARWARTCDSA